MKKEILLIYPNQLFEKHPGLKKDRQVVCIEDELFFTQYKFHKQKIIFHRASMRAYADRLTTQGYTVHYLESHRIPHSHNVFDWLVHNGFTDWYVAELVDDWLEKRINNFVHKHALSLHIISTPAFITSEQEIRSFFTHKKRILMHDFYVWQRKRLGILMEHDKPVGGQWSFDTDNRKKLPKTTIPPLVFHQYTTSYTDEAIAYTEKNFSDYYGNGTVCYYPTTHTEAKSFFKKFLYERFAFFGPYEDALTVRSTAVFHSVLSPLINSGLLTPAFVIKQAVAYAEKNNVPLASYEGFIRQIIGWREFMRAMYVMYGRKMRTSNFFKHKKIFDKKLWDGTTGCFPVDHTIHNVLETGYAHHIERLMVLGNWMLLSEYAPDDIYEWFMTLFIDAYDWVMVPNIYGMSQFADGGIFATKPYISASHYILKMSDFPKGEWSIVWDKKFWNFLEKHQAFFIKQPRMRMLLQKRFSKK